MFFNVFFNPFFRFPRILPIGYIGFLKPKKINEQSLIKSSLGLHGNLEGDRNAETGD